MPTQTDRPIEFARPRPEIVKALGILNVVFAVMILIGLVIGLMWLYAMVRAGHALDRPGANPSTWPAGLSMMGMNDPAFVRFTLIDVVTGLVVNLMMLASGIGLINIHRWGARLWTWTAWIKIARLVVLWGFFYIVLVTPSFSENMARAALAMMNPRLGARGVPSLGQLTRLYAIINLIMAVAMIILGAIYPALSLWMLGRPGVRAALAIGASKEPESP